MRNPRKLPLEKLSKVELEKLSAGGEVLEADGFGPKVYRLDNGLMLKIFRQRRLLSSATLSPYANRFVRNAYLLESHGIPTICPLRNFDLHEKRARAVLYNPLPGQTIAQMVRDGTVDTTVIHDIALFILTLHKKGIYFRSLHIGNIVKTPENRFGLIDIADMRFHSSPLSKALIKRNFKHFKNQLDRFCAYHRCAFPWQSLLDAYDSAD
jgi:hypothetical protein